MTCNEQEIGGEQYESKGSFKKGHPRTDVVTNSRRTL